MFELRRKKENRVSKVREIKRAEHRRGTVLHRTTRQFQAWAMGGTHIDTFTSGNETAREREAGRGREREREGEGERAQ